MRVIREREDKMKNENENERIKRDERRTRMRE